MAGPEFHQTHPGRVFYEGTMPRILETLTRIAVALETLAKATHNENAHAETQVHEAADSPPQ